MKLRIGIIGSLLAFVFSLIPMAQSPVSAARVCPEARSELAAMEGSFKLKGSKKVDIFGVNFTPTAFILDGSNEEASFALFLPTSDVINSFKNQRKKFANGKMLIAINDVPEEVALSSLNINRCGDVGTLKAKVQRSNGEEGNIRIKFTSVNDLSRKVAKKNRARKNLALQNNFAKAADEQANVLAQAIEEDFAQLVTQAQENIANEENVSESQAVIQLARNILVLAADINDLRGLMDEKVNDSKLEEVQTVSSQVALKKLELAFNEAKFNFLKSEVDNLANIAVLPRFAKANSQPKLVTFELDEGNFDIELGEEDAKNRIFETKEDKKDFAVGIFGKSTLVANEGENNFNFNFKEFNKKAKIIGSAVENFVLGANNNTSNLIDINGNQSQISSDPELTAFDQRENPPEIADQKNNEFETKDDTVSGLVDDFGNDALAQLEAELDALANDRFEKRWIVNNIKDSAILDTIIGPYLDDAVVEEEEPVEEPIDIEIPAPPPPAPPPIFIPAPVPPPPPPPAPVEPPPVELLVESIQNITIEFIVEDEALVAQLQGDVGALAELNVNETVNLLATSFLDNFDGVDKFIFDIDTQDNFSLNQVTINDNLVLDFENIFIATMNLSLVNPLNDDSVAAILTLNNLNLAEPLVQEFNFNAVNFIEDEVDPFGRLVRATANVVDAEGNPTLTVNFFADVNFAEEEPAPELPSLGNEVQIFDADTIAFIAEGSDAATQLAVLDTVITDPFNEDDPEAFQFEITNIDFTLDAPLFDFNAISFGDANYSVDMDPASFDGEFNFAEIGVGQLNLGENLLIDNLLCTEELFNGKIKVPAFIVPQIDDVVAIQDVAASFMFVNCFDQGEDLENDIDDAEVFDVESSLLIVDPNNQAFSAAEIAIQQLSADVVELALNLQANPDNLDENGLFTEEAAENLYVPGLEALAIDFLDNNPDFVDDFDSAFDAVFTIIRQMAADFASQREQGVLSDDFVQDAGTIAIETVAFGIGEIGFI